MKTILYNPIFINPQAYYVFPRLTRYLQPDNESTAEPANYIGTIEVKVIAYGDTTLKRTYTNTDSIDLSEFKNTWIRISLFTKVGSCVLGEWKIGNMESDLPYIDPEVLASLKAVVIVGNKTNNDSDRAIVKNLVDASNPFVISNAAFKLNSGFGKYEISLTDSITPARGAKVTDNSIEVVDDTFISSWIYYSKMESAEINSYSIEISGMPEGKLVQYWYNNKEGVASRFDIKEDGIYTLPQSYVPADTGSNKTIGLRVQGSQSQNFVGFKVRIIPSFEGAFVTDGINDLITSTKTVQEMLGGSNEFTVVSMMANLDSRQILCNSNYSNTNGYNVRNTLEPNGVISMLGYTDKNGTTNNINLIMGDKDSIKLVDKVNFNSDYVFYPAQYYKTYYQVAWYWTIIANKVLTTDQINQVIAYFNLDRTLKPDILCNIGKQGITNDNHADFNDKLVDYSGNGRDVQMNNLAWKGGSGVAAKPYETFKDWTSESSSTSIITQIDEFTRIVESTTNGYWVSRIRRDSDLNKVYDAINVYLYQDNNFLVHECKYEVDGIKYTIPINESVGKGYHKLEMYTKDRYTELPENAENIVLSEWYFPKSTKGSIKYSVIPSYKGGILLDGINDFGKVTRMPIYKDYTFIIDRQIISIGNIFGIVASKSESATDTTKQGAFLFEYLGAPNNISTWSFYNDNHKVGETDFTRGISYQSKYSYNGIELLAGTALDSDKLWLGILRDRDSRFANVAIYSLMSFPYSMSKFLIERQLKKYKLGTLYPNMVEFRPIIKANDNYKIFYTAMLPLTGDIWERINTGDYVPVGRRIAIQMSFDNEAKKLVSAVSSQLGNITIVKNSNNIGYTIFGDVLKDKSPQKISITIEQDENYVLFNPVINSNYDNYKLTFHLREYEKLINIGDYIPKGTYIRANLYLKNDIDELVTFTFNGVNIDYAKSPVLDTAYNIRQIYNYDSPQEVNITIDEYIRYEDIKQPYPLLFEFTDENGNLISWGGKAKVGNTITRTKSVSNANILAGLYNTNNYKLNGKPLEGNSYVVEKQMVFTCTATYLLDDNEPKCILSPRLLRIPNSSYKILGHIPDISGHGNHGKINNSAYAEGSGVNEDGSYQFDGVDDFVTIPTTVGGKQMLMKVNWQKSPTLLYDQRASGSFAVLTTKEDDAVNSRIAYQGRNQDGKTYIDGIENNNIETYTLKDITHNITIANSSLGGIIVPVIGCNTGKTSSFAKMSLYDFMLFDEISTDDKIKELNEYVGIEGNTE